VSSLEDRLRNAYRSTVDNAAPAAMQDLEDLITRRSRPARPKDGRRRRVMVPVAAAAAVTAVAVLAVALPHAVGLRQAGQRPPTAPPAGPEFLIEDAGGVFPLVVRNVATGAVVAHVNLKESGPGPTSGRTTYVFPVITPDGHTFVAGIYQLDPCRSWLYQFRLSAQGQPTTPTAFAPLPTTDRQILSLAVSENGKELAYAAGRCGAAASYLAVTDIATRQTRQWAVPAGRGVGDVSLTANGSLLSYIFWPNSSETSTVVRVMPTDAAPGSVADRGRTVARAAQFGRSDWISFAAVSADGSAVYFTTRPEATFPPLPWAGQVRVVDLATGRSRLVRALAGQPGGIVADPSVRHLLLQIQQPGSKGPPVRLARLDLATGRITYLPSAWIPTFGINITW
jgi:hypothetical protein